MANGAVCLFALLALCSGNQSAAAGTEEQVVGEVGGDVTLTCWNASRQAVGVEWFHGEPGAIPILFSSDGKLPSDARLSLVGNSSLHISGLRRQDEGNYTCKEVLNETEHRHRTQLLVASGPDRVSINISPTTALPNGTLYARRYDIVNFTCASDSQPVPTTEWSFIQPSSTQELFTEVNNSLGYFVLYNISPRYQGNYSCSATNPLSSHRATATYELLIYYPPPLSPRCWAQTSTEDSGMVQLFCTWPGGYPHPTLQWTNQKNITWAFDTINRTDTIVANLNRSHLPYGKEFVCHGQHITNQEESQACPIQLEGPLVMSDPLRTCFEGRAAIMTCRATAGNPPAKITWLHNVTQPGTEIQSGGRFLIRQKGSVSTLLIQNCSHGADEGYYLCKAENPLGVKEVYVHLRVTEPVNIGGIVGAIVALLLLVVLIVFGIFLYAGPRFWPKSKNSLKNSPRLIKMAGSSVSPVEQVKIHLKENSKAISYMENRQFVIK
uniref:V-set and immunoglobulin domain-containing protein 10 isoform X1 n=1 Tax=Pogona vitticeps TaxID=103695 RepID=UPI003BB8CA14